MVESSGSKVARKFDDFRAVIHPSTCFTLECLPTREKGLYCVLRVVHDLRKSSAKRAVVLTKSGSLFSLFETEATVLDM